MEDASLYKKVLNAMSAQVAILDESGIIIETNQSWRQFGKENDQPQEDFCRNRNYLQICESGGKDSDGGRVAAGIRQVINGEVKEFLMQYPCHSPQEKRWYAVRVVAFREGEMENGGCRVIVSHENITAFVKAQEALREKEYQLGRQAERLEETNIALKVLLEQRNQDKKQMETALFSNVERLVLPYIDKLSGTRMNEHQKTLVEVVRANLQEILSPFLRQLSAQEARLTPQEIEIAHLIRQGRSSKEIAELLFLSVAGVDFHRKNMRRKFGLTHTNRNLRSFLMSLQ